MKKAAAIIMSMILFALSAASCAADGYTTHEPYGEGVGVCPGRVVWAHDSDSVTWDGSGYWWDTSHFDEDKIQKMVDDSIAALAGKDNAADGYDALFRGINERRQRTGGYKSGEKIAIKANINGSAVMDDDTSGETQMSYTNPVLLKTLLLSLVKDAGAAPEDITVYDVSRLFPEYMEKMCTEGILSGVNFVNRENGVADENAPIVWSHEFSGAVNYLPTCVTEADYVINLANLKGHSYGITLCGKNHFGSFINGNAMRPPEGANLHQWLTRSEMGIYSPLVDLMANAELGGKTVLYMLDALICAPSEGASITKENSTWQQEPFNGGFTASVFTSQDPVAIDSVGADFLINEPTVTNANTADGKGNAVTNLGVHEHWNNPTDKQYSRNLGKNEGIELVMAKQSAGGNVTAKYTTDGENITITGVDGGARLIIAEYSEGGRLVGCKMYKPENGVITAPDMSDTVRVKTFLWNMDTLEPINVTKTDAEENLKISVKIADAEFTATLEDNETAAAFKAMLPMTLDMSELNGNEKYNYLSADLPTAAESVGTINAGDIMLYGSNCAVLFYETFDTPYSYTRIGHIDDVSGLKEAVGGGNVTVTFE